ncbi:MAG: cytidine deaminase [Bacteroidales bacterium]|jgi:cytidine deaminase|nr:cytidine deaminase [Bacteroidales bacterium]
MKKTIEIPYEELSSEKELSIEEQNLLAMAEEATKNSYSPYSKFHVGAALLLENGEIITGNNQENAAYPTGLCAERVAFFYSGAKYPNVPIKTVAITAYSEEIPVSSPVPPCGDCRQAMIEYEERYGKKIRVIMRGATGKVIIFDKIADLLPFHFDNSDLGM